MRQSHRQKLRSDWPQKGTKGDWGSGENRPRAYGRDAGHSTYLRFLCLFVAKKSGTARRCEALELYSVVALGDLFQLLLGVDLYGAAGDVGVGRQTQDHLGRPWLKIERGFK